ncbi:MAG: hypothetical protein ACLQGP_42695 [Isosphaeraceae bacterium]
MSAAILHQSTYTLTLRDEERDKLLDLLRRSLGEARVEVHRTHTPAFRESVIGQEDAIRSLIEKLERLCPDEAEVSTKIPAGIEEGTTVPDVVYIDEQGRFQMATEDLEGFVEFLRENKVRVEVETADAFHSGGKAYGYARLLHLYDADSANALYRTWKQLHEGRAVGELA